MARSSCDWIASALVSLIICVGDASWAAESKTICCNGTVVNVDGVPLFGAVVTAYKMLSDDVAGSLRVEKAGEITTADDGAFAFASLPEPALPTHFIQTYVVASKEGLAPDWVVWDGRGDLKATLVLGEPAGAEGLVVDEVGRPIADARVLANLQRIPKTTAADERKEWLTGLVLPGRLETRTDRLGRFVFRELPGDVEIAYLISAAGRATIYTQDGDQVEPFPVLPGQPGVRFALPPEGRITGQIIDPDTGRGAAGAEFAVVPASSGLMYYRLTRTTDPNGVFVVGELKAGRYLLRGKDLRNRYVEVESGGTAQVTLRINRTWYGRILFHDGAPAIVKPSPWRGARTLVFWCDKDHPIGGEIARLDNEGYFRVDLSAEQTRKLQSGQAWFDVLTPIRRDASESGYRWKRESVLTAEFLTRDKADAGVVRIEGPLRGPVSLIGKALPPLEPFGLGDVGSQTEGRVVLVCFFDMDQRPSRNCLASLAQRMDKLEQEGVSLVLIHGAQADGVALERWLKERNIDVPAGSMETDGQDVKWAWGVKSLPWLILTDENHIVVAEGFAVDEVNARIENRAGGYEEPPGGSRDGWLKNLEGRRMNGVKCVVIALLTGFVTAGSAEGPTDATSPVTLETLRRRVLNNQRLIDPIKLNYTVSISRTGERPRPAGGMRRPGRSSSHYDVVWAQSGGRQYVREQHFYGPNEPGRSDIEVLDGRLRTHAERPERVSIGPVRNTDWHNVLPAKLRLRPFEDQRWLSEVLVRPHATLLQSRETVDGRTTCVVDITRPEYGASVSRFWIDEDSGLPLRVRAYAGHPDAPNARLVTEVKNVTPYRLPNGGWIPVSGVRVIHAEGLGGCERVAVDVNSITVRPDDVPDSLFRLNPPEGGSVYNVFTCLTTVHGSELKTYEQIVKGPDTCVSGVVVDAEGAPVARTVVVPFGITMAQSHKLIQPFERICSVTDGQGRFALELEEEGRYDLQFYSAEFVDKESRDVPLGEHDLKVVLDRGGAVTGRVFFMAGGRKAPLSRVSVRAQAGDRLMDVRMRSVRKETMTDDEGRFEFTCLPTRMRERSIASSEPPRYVPLPWQISCGSTSESILLRGDGDRREVELVLKPDVRSAPPLVGRSLPDLAGLGLDVAADDVKGCKLLICFFDMEQRPARNCVEELAKRATALKDQGVSVFAIVERGIGSDKLQAWAKEAGVTIPLGITAGDPAEVRFAWAVRSLPWLILTDENRVVAAEGFTLDELDVKIGAIESTTK